MQNVHFRDWSIRQKLIAMSLLASGAALASAATVYMTYDYFAFRKSLATQLTVLADITSFNVSSAVLFKDAASAEKTLAALHGRRGLRSAQIYNPQGELFSRWVHDPGFTPAPCVPTKNRMSSHHFKKGSLTLSYPMIFQNASIGDLCLESDLADLTMRLRRYAGLTVIVLGISFGLALVVSYQVGLKISQPILQLAAIAEAFSEKKDYSVRASAAGQDELGHLTRTFNLMLSKIQNDEQALRRARDDLERRVEERTTQLTAANKELEAFSYSVSHDLRAPLRHIGGFSNLLLEDPVIKQSESGSRYLNTIVDSARHMGRLIDDLLAFSRMGRAELMRTTVDLNKMVEDIQKDLSLDLKDRKIEWKIESLPKVLGDPSMLKQVMVNLLSNAVKYTRPRDQAIIEIGSLEKNSDERVIFVRDNGVGFDMKYVEKLFGVFQRLHSAEEFEGTGIGLANVRRIIHRHGGRAWAEAKVDQGATFYFSLPNN
jgi:signal transduction histidine kinase